MPHTTLLPGEAAPELSFDRLGADRFELASEPIDRKLILLFYRGVHCPACRNMLEELNGREGDFGAVGARFVAVSMDSRERAERQKSEWDIGKLDIGYGLTERQARSYGLFISEKIQDKEPPHFSEPGTVILMPDRSIYAVFVQSVPFTRPSLDGLLNGLKFVQEKGFPPRGTVPG